MGAAPAVAVKAVVFVPPRSLPLSWQRTRWAGTECVPERHTSYVTVESMIIASGEASWCIYRVAPHTHNTISYPMHLLTTPTSFKQRICISSQHSASHISSQNLSRLGTLSFILSTHILSTLPHHFLNILGEFLVFFRFLDTSLRPGVIQARPHLFLLSIVDFIVDILVVASRRRRRRLRRSK